MLSQSYTCHALSHEAEVFWKTSLEDSPPPYIFLSVRKADLKKGFQHLVVLLLVVVVVVVVVVVGTRVNKRF
jgi:hypothetical protein